MSNIDPVDKTTTQTIVKFTLDISSLVLGVSAIFRAVMYDANDNVIDKQNVSLEGEDYTNWGNDDEYVIQFAADQLGFTITS